MNVAERQETVNGYATMEEAFQAWRSREAYIDGQGNYHVRRPGHSSGPIASWNKAVKAAYATVTAFHQAAGAAEREHAVALACAPAPQTVSPVMLPALTAAVARAKAAFPAATVRIEKGLSLVLQDRVSDRTQVTPHTYTVESQARPWQHYDVVSNGRTGCQCPDYERHATHDNGYLCKHGFAVLLVRSAQREARQHTLRHAYHMASGEEGHARRLVGNRAVFHPGGHAHSVVCAAEELCFGPPVRCQGRPAEAR